MKVEELMLNDLVLCKGLVYTVISIDYIGSLVGIEMENDIDLVYIDEIESIQLTKEILQKNWFSYIAGHYGNGIGDRYVKDGFELRINRISFHIYCAMLCFYINSVHEPQHALRLCGLKELADNLKVE